MKRGTLIIFIFAILLWAECAACAQSSANLELTWAHGVCRHCQTATSIEQVQFVSPTEAWAIGYVPPGEVGAGDYSVLHTKNGAMSWKEYPSSYSHNDPPQFSFPDRREGWMLVADVPNAENRLLSTNDAGEHWRRLGLRDPYVDKIQYLGNGVGFAHWINLYPKIGKIYRSVDVGRRWTKYSLPRDFSVDQMSFVDAARGWLAGCLNHQVVVLRTVDGGRRWGVAHLDLPKATPISNYCDLSVDDLSVRSDGRGLLLVNKDAFKNGDNLSYAAVFRTADGGATWTPVYRKTLTIPVVSSSVPGATGYIDIFPLFTAARLIDAHSMLIFKNDGILLVSTDDGAHWREMQLPHPVGSCRSSIVGLACAAGNPNEFWVLKVSAKP